MLTAAKHERPVAYYDTRFDDASSQFLGTGGYTSERVIIDPTGTKVSFRLRLAATYHGAYSTLVHLSPSIFFMCRCFTRRVVGVVVGREHLQFRDQFEYVGMVYITEYWYGVRVRA